jgi:hypothetical protein
MIETVLVSPDLVNEAKQNGVYGNILFWLVAARQGNLQRFPYASASSAYSYQKIESRSSSESESGTESNSSIVISPAAKALDYFQESLELLGIDEDGITLDKLKAGYRTAALRAHPDKPGGSKDAFDEVVRAFKYVEKILMRINPTQASFTTPVTMESAMKMRSVSDEPAPVKLSSKKLDLSSFNKLFMENRLPDPSRDTGYGDWMTSSPASDAIENDPRLRGKYNSQTFETVFRERAIANSNSMAITKRLEPDALVTTGGTELGGETTNFSAPFGSETPFMDLKEAYTTGSTRFQEVADVKIQERSVRSVDEAKRIRETEMARVDPDETARIAMSAAAHEERERQRRLRAAKEDTAAESWAEQMRRRLFVTDK